jgi:hypothetical protein
MRETFRSALPKWLFLLVLLCFILIYLYLMLVPEFPEPPPQAPQ